MLSTLLAAAALTLPLSQQSTPQASTSEVTAEGAEILRRILVESLDNAFREEDGAEVEVDGLRFHGAVTTLWAGNDTVQHSRAFHLPGAGLFFSFDASLPIVSVEKTAPATGDAPTHDEWERFRREVRGDGSERQRYLIAKLVDPTQEVTAGQIDPQAIETVVDLLLRGVARHAGRIEGLGPSETLTLAVHLSGRDRTWLHDLSSQEDPSAESEHQELAFTQRLSAVYLRTGRSAKDQNLVVRVALSDLSGDVTPERLRQRAQIHLY